MRNFPSSPAAVAVAEGSAVEASAASVEVASAEVVPEALGSGLSAPGMNSMILFFVIS